MTSPAHVLLALATLTIPITARADTAAPAAPTETEELVLVERAITTRVMGREYSTVYIVPATVKSRSGGQVTVVYEDESEATRPEAEVRAPDWKEGTSLMCRAKGNPEADYTGYRIKAVEGTQLKVDSGSGIEVAVPMSLCRQKHPMEWWAKMSPRFKNHDSYAPVKKLPDAKRKDPTSGAIEAALGAYLETADGGAYIKVKKCVPTSATFNEREDATSGAHTARTIDVACTVGVPLPPKPRENEACIVLYGLCRQEYLGNGRYGGCVFQNTDQTPNKTACK